MNITYAQYETQFVALVVHGDSGYAWELNNMMEAGKGLAEINKYLADGGVGALKTMPVCFVEKRIARWK